MARIAGIDLPKNKRGVIGLTYIYGIGSSTAKEILSLPMYPELTEKKVAFVADKINEFNLSLN